MSIKDPHTRIKPLALASGHSRHMVVTLKRALVSVGEFALYMDYRRCGLPVYIQVVCMQ